MKSEDFYKEHYNEQWQPKDKFDKQKKQFDYYDLIDFAEAYHQHRVNSISDDDVVTLIKWVSDRGFDNINAIDVRLQYKRKIQQLLKQ